MKAPRKGWKNLAPATKKRYKAAGITPRQYAAGKSLTAARGHAKTPERPARAAKAPEKYPEYVAKRPHLTAPESPRTTSSAPRIETLQELRDRAYADSLRKMRQSSAPWFEPKTIRKSVDKQKTAGLLQRLEYDPEELRNAAKGDSAKDYFYH